MHLIFRLFHLTLRQLQPCMQAILQAAEQVYSNRHKMGAVVRKYEMRQRMQVSKMHDASWIRQHDGLSIASLPPIPNQYNKELQQLAAQALQHQKLGASSPPRRRLRRDMHMRRRTHSGKKRKRRMFSNDTSTRYEQANYGPDEDSNMMAAI